MTDQDDLFSVNMNKASFVVQPDALVWMPSITFREVTGGEEALLGVNVVGRINLHPHEQKKKASWICFIPNRVGIRTISPAEVADKMEGRRALTACLQAWLRNCAVAPDA